jgi:hypothetical protein
VMLQTTVKVAGAAVATWLVHAIAQSFGSDNSAQTSQ